MATDPDKQRWLRLATSKHPPPALNWLANVVIGVRLTAADEKGKVKVMEMEVVMVMVTLKLTEMWLTLHQWLLSRLVLRFSSSAQ